MNDIVLPDPSLTARAERMALSILAEPEDEQSEAALFAVLAYRDVLAEEFPGQPQELIDRTARAFAGVLGKKLEAIELSSGAAVGHA